MGFPIAEEKDHFPAVVQVGLGAVFEGVVFIGRLLGVMRWFDGRRGYL